MIDMDHLLESSIRKVEKWVEDRDYKGYEPFDGLSSFLKPLTCNSLLGERLLQQLVRQSPLNLRPFLGIKPLDSTKGRGYMAWGYLNMFRLTGEDVYRDKASRCLEWLIRNRSPLYAHYSWGNHFPFSGREVRLPRHEPITVWSSLIGQAFLDAYEILDNNRYLEVADNICEWILDLPKERTVSGSCISYVASSQSSIHNSNMLGAAMLARTAKFTGNTTFTAVAREAMEYSCARQLPTGAWYYGEKPNLHWIDNFHTGYNLDSLKCYIDSTGEMAFADHLVRGLKFYREHFFEGNGRPKYYHNRAYPIDSQCASQAIQTLANFSDDDESSLELALRVAKWTIEHMQDRDGHFYYRQYPLGIKAKTPMLHWAQATTYKALTLLLLKTNNHLR